MTFGSFVYRAFVAVLGLLVGSRCPVDVKDVEVLVLRHQLEVLRRQSQHERRFKDVRFLIRDRDTKFTKSFDDVFRADGVQIQLTSYRCPQANGYAERFVRTVRSECLDWLLILRPRHLQRVLRVYVEHDNTQRPHRALGRLPPLARPPPPTPPAPTKLERLDRLGGLIHEYQAAAA